MKVVRYRTETGVRIGAIVSEGRKNMQVLLLDNPLRMRSVPLAEQRYMTELDYKPSRFKRHLRHAARAWHGGLRNVPKTVRAAIRRDK